MFITNLDEVLALLRGRLKDYLALKHRLQGDRQFLCFLHEERTPSMGLVRKTGDEVAYCFGCGNHADIFTAASALEGLPAAGPEWITETVVSLCKSLGVPLRLGEITERDRERLKYQRLTQDIADILTVYGLEQIPYLKERRWEQEHLPLGAISQETLMARLAGLGWNPSDVLRSLLVRTNTFSYFGEDRLTFVVKSHMGSPIGFVTRPFGTLDKGKYVNSCENPLYQKSQVLLGLETAKLPAKQDGLFVVEGPGDLAQLYRVGILNAVSTCGTALTEGHLLQARSLGIRKLYLCLDWDEPGQRATQRILEEVLPKITGIAVQVVKGPAGVKDPDELLRDSETSEGFLGLERKSAFSWLLERLGDGLAPEDLCTRVVGSIASEPAAVKRELLIRELAQYTGISQQSIAQDVHALKNNTELEQQEQVRAEGQRYLQALAQTPGDVGALLAEHEQQIQRIEKEHEREHIGINYQISRFNALQEARETGEDFSDFKMQWFQRFARTMSGGQSWGSDAMMYVGGMANTGKTALVIALGADVALSDDDAIVIFHMTDDSYLQVEPRLKTNFYRMLEPNGEKLRIGDVVRPNLETHRQLQIANDAIQGLLGEERLVILDSEDGPTLTVLERHLRYYRSRYPSRKILVVLDNTHNLVDFGNLDQTTRMRKISDYQKLLTTKYHCCMIATAEYKKDQLPQNPQKIRWPHDNDLADSRALFYRPQVIMHVYNDLHSRPDNPEIFWVDRGGILKPRLAVSVTKNKISGWKQKLMFDLDPETVSLRERSYEQAFNEYQSLPTPGEEFPPNHEDSEPEFSRYLDVQAAEYQEAS